ncbi:Glycosyltransferase like family protein [Flavobacterium resistens]|uniref:Glycosyltransferase like family protein n=1 Tax=Flavobacterium resistens TaxID=443612 RepID=A0A521ER53_9FLAO|nr:glycosyltransferase [Flavobacterium resistens]MRX67909.1 hypothetical protein [Flavobacterium resistens]SMO86423.1 Glycosyltransferase like family protein [Flavobacterium resistens]
MISIIVCSRTSDISLSLRENLEKTIGCIYELIIIDNSKNTHSIFEAYNLGIQKSKFEFLCFIHDDICMHTQDWGKIIVGIFKEDLKIGLIGIAGSKIKSKMPSPWWNCPNNQSVINIIQHYSHKDKESMTSGFNEDLNVEAAVLDGVFMSARKVEKIQFDSKMAGFHNYDLNISLEYKKHDYKVVITKQLLLEHFSTGKLNEDWVKSCYYIHRKYKSILPLNNKSHIVSKETEIANAANFIEESVTFKKYRIAFFIWLKLFTLHPRLKWQIRFLKRILNKL